MPRRRRTNSSQQIATRTSSPELMDATPPAQRNAANARERARMRVLSKAFCRLKTTLPWVPADTKLSKLDTLRLATSYIAHLRAALATDDTLDSTAATERHPLNLTWPFTFQNNIPVAPSALRIDNSRNISYHSSDDIEDDIDYNSPLEITNSNDEQLTCHNNNNNSSIANHHIVNSRRQAMSYQYLNTFTHEDRSYETINEWHQCQKSH